MKIAEIKVKLTGKDVYEGICEYVQVENFKVEKISFEEIITVVCSFKKGIKIAIKVKMEIEKVIDNVIYFRILDINIAKIHILKGIKNFALQKLLKDFMEQGISIEKETISVKLNVILKKIPQINFSLKELYTLNGELQVNVENLEYLKENDELPKEIEEIEKSVEHIKIEDKYTKLREKINAKVSPRYVNFAEYAFMLPDIIILMGRLIKDDRVSLKTKAVIGSIAAYYVSPIDFAMIFIPFFGEVSALTLGFYGLSYIIQEVPEDIIIENWQGKEIGLQKLKQAVEALNKVSSKVSLNKLIGLRKKTNKKQKV